MFPYFALELFADFGELVFLLRFNEHELDIIYELEEQYIEGWDIEMNMFGGWDEEYREI